MGQVEADQVARIFQDAQQDWRFTAGRRANAGLGDQTFGKQVKGDFGYGSPGEAGGAGDIRPADAFAFEDCFQDQVPVVLFGLLPGRFFENKIYRRMAVSGEL
jgi:hypothetical protein